MKLHIMNFGITFISKWLQTNFAFKGFFVHMNIFVRTDLVKSTLIFVELAPPRLELNILLLSNKRL